MKKRSFIKTTFFVSLGLLFTATAFADPYQGRSLQEEISPSFLEARKGKSEDSRGHAKMSGGKTFQSDGYGSINEVCKGKKKGEKANFTTPNGAKVNVICGDTPPRMDGGKR